ncbi:MAG: SNF2 helicase-associated domain-containing protein [Mycobacteriales bacterium]
MRRRTVPARFVPVAAALPELLNVNRYRATPSLAARAVAATAAVGLIARGRLLPTITPQGLDAWRIGPLDAADADWLRTLAAAFPPLAHALPVSDSEPLRMRSAESLIRSAWDAIADTLVRTPAAGAATGTALFAGTEATLVPSELASWLLDSVRGLDAGARAGLRLELPDSPAEPFRAVVQLRSAADPSLIVDTSALWQAPAAVLARFGPQAETDLLLTFRWRLTLGGESLTDEEVEALAEAKRPLIRHRGRWVAADSALIAKLRQRMAGGAAGELTGMEALAAALSGELEVGGSGWNSSYTDMYLI